MTADGNLSSEEISSVWWRQKPFGLFYPENPTRNAEQEFIGREWHHILNSVPAFTSHANWINPVNAQVIANSKPQQLLWALSSGFSVPETMFSNDFESVLSFVKRETVVYKTMSGYIFPESSAIFTARLSEDFIVEEDRLRIGVSPGIYQSYVEKKCEMRVYFIGDDIFSVEIDSQSSDDTKTDWRENQSLPINSYVKTDSYLRDKISRFRDMSGLKFGAVDLVVTPSEEIVFLECNPAGQWMWLEEATGVPISKSVAALLSQA